MTKVLIVFGSTDGQTKKIAEFMSRTMRSTGVSVDLVNAAEAGSGPDPKAYDAVIAAASIHAGGYQAAVRRWAKSRAGALATKPNAFISVCLGVLESKPETHAHLSKILGEFQAETGWKPQVSEHVAGALRYTQYGFLKKWMMKRIAGKAGGATDTSRDHEYTDWSALERFTIEFLARNRLVKAGAPEPRIASAQL